jgi:TRAP-type uncharacterized transport system substrate-binding protein
MRLSAAKPQRACSCGAETARRGAKSARSVRLALALPLLAGQPALAQLGIPDQPQMVAQRSVGVRQQLSAKVNQETLVIAASRPGTSYMAMASDLAAAVGRSGRLRLLPVAGEGGMASLQDLLFLRGIDLAIVPANVLARAKTTSAFGGALPQRVAYVTTLYSEGVHIVAGPGIATIGDLRGKRIAVPSGDGTVQFTAGDIFKRLGIGVESVSMDPVDAFEEVRGERIAAVLLVGGKPLAQVSALPKDGSLRLLSLPFQAQPGEGYVPAVFLPEDYPALIPPGTMVETVAVGAVLMVNKVGNDAALRIAKHTPALLDAVGTLAVSQRHPSWKDVNLNAVQPGWFRIKAAERWLNEAVAQRKKQLKGTSEPARAQKPVGSSGLSATHQRKKLFDEFEAWARQSAAAQPAPE